ncbi:CheY chemotaxis protein or a CheY-like REC (receiver) domain [Methanococcoides vulcani]|uniref:CheY chemotaxis protein or a CheY-like REC (Receiver) domain n=1 Tax=Methanococcoides vulcani TaxID=1353158 RepID=A0A1I0AMG9_9EURY|nr:response regulator [Methanococcoides vulcani]SES95361.1 CheY chemotaxis protein or a CheY-like REC (receiver) domain [Methanococcoides vulcani]
MKGANILVVEDENIVALSIKNKLEMMGYSVVDTASSGEDAVVKADLFYPDLVLMDVMLRGEMDGIEAAEKIREKFDIPVIFLTAYTDDNTLERAKIAEPYGYISKPFKEQDLKSNIEMALHKHENEIRLK